MGGPVSVVLAGCFMAKVEKLKVTPSNPKFYKRYVDDIYVRRKKNETDHLFNQLNSFHRNLKFTFEVNPSKFLDTKIIRNQNELSFLLVAKESKLPSHWSSAVPKRYKRNIINGELHRAKRISSIFNYEKTRIFKKFKKASYPTAFINSVIRDFERRLEPDDDVNLIPEWLFKEESPTVRFQLPFCHKNQKCSSKLIKTLQKFTGNKVKFEISWKTRNIKSLFPIKDKVVHHSSVIYKGTCSCGDQCVGETVRNAKKIRWKEHDRMAGKSEPSKHVVENSGHAFTWEIISKAPKNNRKRKTLEAFYILKFKPKINDQLDIRCLRLFKNGIT